MNSLYFIPKTDKAASSAAFSNFHISIASELSKLFGGVICATKVAIALVVICVPPRISLGFQQGNPYTLV